VDGDGSTVFAHACESRPRACSRVSMWMWTLAFGHHEDRTRLCRDTRVRHGGIREELAATLSCLSQLNHGRGLRLSGCKTTLVT
jgi:hypothetical protein